MMNTLEIKNIYVSYGQIPALKDVSLTIKEGEIVTLLGSNGAGKTTLINSILGIQKAHKGQIIFEGEDITRLSTEKIVASGISVVPEGRGVLGDMTVQENLELGAYHVKGKLDDALERIYNRFPVLGKRKFQKSGTLSGGEQQMLSIGRALMSSPKLLVLDELSLALAPVLVDQVFEILHELKSENLTILLSEQNARKALQCADTGYVLDVGRVTLSGSAAELSVHSGVSEAYLGGTSCKEDS